MRAISRCGMPASVNGSPEGAIVLEGGELEASFVTVTGYDRALQCASRASAVVRNSVLLSWSDEAAIECTTLEATYSAFEVSFAGHGNQSVGPLQPGLGCAATPTGLSTTAMSSSL